MQVASVVSGTFFKEKIETAVRHVGTNSFCSTVAELHKLQPRVVLVDLEHPRAAEVLREFGTSVIAFGPHVRSDLVAIAKEFGAQVYPRSIFFNDLDKLLHQYQGYE